MFYDRSTKWYGEHEGTVTKSFFFYLHGEIKEGCAHCWSCGEVLKAS